MPWLVIGLGVGSSCATGPGPADDTRTGADVSQKADDDGDVERVLSQQLQAEAGVEREFLYGKPIKGTFLCGIEVLGYAAPDTYYATVLCGDFPNDGGAMASGGVSPAVISVHGQGSAALVTDVKFPRQSHWHDDLVRLFPEGVFTEAVSGSPRVTPTPQELQQAAAQ
jgi:hypothetical protein